MSRVEVDFWRDTNAGYIPYWQTDVSVDQYSFTKIDSIQPKYACYDCAMEYSYFYTLGRGNNKGFTRQILREQYVDHHGSCECCNKNDIDLYDVKNLGYFYQGWQNRKYRNN